MEITTTYTNRTINARNTCADEIDVTIAFILKQLGMSGHVCGYFYLKRCIRLAINCEDDMYRVTKEMYPVVAKEFKTAVSAVERGIRQCISNINCSDEVKMAYIGWLSDGYTNKQIIASIAELVKMNMINAEANKDQETHSEG